MDSVGVSVSGRCLDRGMAMLGKCGAVDDVFVRSDGFWYLSDLSDLLGISNPHSCFGMVDHAPLDVVQVDRTHEVEVEVVRYRDLARLR
jgi:hypothetical protein